MSERPRESGRYGSPFDIFRSRLWLVLLALAGCGDRDAIEGVSWNDPDGSNCDYQCWRAGREQEEQWECNRAFDPRTSEPLAPGQTSEQGQATCRKVTEEASGAGDDDPNKPAGANCPTATTEFFPYDPCAPEPGGADGGAGDAGTPPSPADCAGETTCGAFCAEQRMVCVTGGYDEDGDGVGCGRHIHAGDTCACKPRDCD